MELQQALEQRYSCRCFSDQVPSEADILAVLEAGRLAPSARNLQPTRVWVVTSPEDLEKIDAATPCRYNAPVVFIIGYDSTATKDHDTDRGYSWSYGTVDSTAFLMQMMFKATDLGMTTCWLGAYRDEAVRELFDIPDNIEIRALLDLGYADEEKGGPSPKHTDRQPLEQTVTWL